MASCHVLIDNRQSMCLIVLIDVIDICTRCAVAIGKLIIGQDWSCRTSHIVVERRDWMMIRLAPQFNGDFDDLCMISMPKMLGRVMDRAMFHGVRVNVMLVEMVVTSIPSAGLLVGEKMTL